jgi:O-antigen ligase
MMTAVGRFHQLFPILLPLKPVLVTGAAAIIFYLLQQRGARNVNALRAPSTKYLFLLLTWVALSVPGALHPGVAFALLTGSFVKTVVLFVVIAGSVRGFRDVERLTFAYFVAATVYAAVVLVRFDVGGNAWRLAGLYYYDANDYATFAVSALPLGLYFALGQHRWLRRLVGVGGLLALLITIVWSGSRGGFLALLAVAAFILFRFTAISKTWRTLGAAAAVIILLTTASDAYWTQMRTILTPDEDYNRTSDVGRWKTWKRGMGYMLLHPVFGVGAANFPIAEGTISPLAKQQEIGRGVRWGAAHNSFVQVGSELGIPGLLFFLSFLGSGFASLARFSRQPRGAPKSRDGPPQLAQALTASLVGWVVGALFLSLGYSEMVYALLALSTGLRKVTLLSAIPSAPAPTRR